MKKLLFLAIFIMLGSCSSTGIPKSSTFDSDDENGLALIGTKGADDFTVLFAMLDEKTKQLDVSFFSGHEGLSHKGGAQENYSLIEMKPGTYVLKSVNFSTYSANRTTNHVHCLNSGTYKFKIHKGEILYFGDITFTKGDLRLAKIPRISYSPGSLEKAERTMLPYKGIKEKVQIASLKRTSFIKGTDLFRTQSVCGGYY